jgi:hypothetical protein
MNKYIGKLRPAVDKKILVLMAGLMWCGVGIMLLGFSFSWLSSIPSKSQLIYASAGFLAAMPIHHFGFLRLADKNLARLLPVTEKKCFFSFMTWKSYLIVPLMVSMGIFLRHSSLPREYLSVIYTGIGLGLFLSGVRYFRFFFELLLFKTRHRTNLL